MKHRHLPYTTIRNGKPVRARAISKELEGATMDHFKKVINANNIGKLEYPEDSNELSELCEQQDIFSS